MPIDVNDFANCQPNREWLQELDRNPPLSRQLLQHWWEETQKAFGVIYDRIVGSGIELENAHEQPRWHTFFHVRWPENYENITDLLVGWCDLFMTNIDATPLMVFHDSLYSWWREPLTTQIPSFFDLEAQVLAANRVVDRLKVILNYRAETPPAEPIWISGVFGLSMTDDYSRIKRTGFPKEIDFSGSALKRYLAKKVIEASGNPLPSDAITEENYPFEWGGRYAAWSDLREAFKTLGLTVVKNCLVEMKPARE